jgi:hypothetical protein
MVANAAAMGANAVTMMRFDSTDMGAGRTEIVAYGTARVIVPVGGGADAAPAATASTAASAGLQG